MNLNGTVTKISITSLKHAMNKSLSSYEQAELAYTQSDYSLLCSTIPTELAITLQGLKTTILGGWVGGYTPH